MTTYDHAFGDKSLANLEGVLPALAEVAAKAITLCRFDGTIINGGGMRTEAQAQMNVLNKTGILNSRHRVQPDGYGHAIDLIPLTPGKGIDWSNMTAFKAMANAVKQAAAELGVPIRQGCDWNMNGVFNEKREYDWAHFEDPIEFHKAEALAEMHRFQQAAGLSPIDTPEPDGAVCPWCAKPIALSKG